MAVETGSLVFLADQLGRNALPAFMAALLVAALSAGGLALLLGHRARRARADPADPIPAPAVTRLIAGYAAGFLSILGAASLFAAIAVRLGPGGSLGQADQALADAIGPATPSGALRAFSLITHLGDPVVLSAIGVCVAAWLWFCSDRVLALGWVVALAGNAVLNPLLKQVFERARPLHDHGLAHAVGFSFPSGHSSGAMVTYGMLLYVGLRVLPDRWHPLAAMGAVALILTIACSRVFLQVHFASDVVAGLLSGASWLGVCVASLALVRRRQARAKAAATPA